MLTLNLKKPDSSQFISEIQYEKDWAAAKDRKPEDHFNMVHNITGSFSSINQELALTVRLIANCINW